jgi:hypothetical protein
VPRFRSTFTTPFAQHTDREGQPFVVLAIIDRPDSDHAAEALPAYRIRFEDGVEVTARPEEVEADPPVRRVEFVMDSGDYEVGMLRWRFTYDSQHGEPAEALEAAVHTWLATDQQAGTADSLSQALDEIPDQVLAGVGLGRVVERRYEEVELRDRLLELDA